RSEWVVPVSSPPIRDGALVIDRDEIVAVGPAVEILARYGDRAIEDRSIGEMDGPGDISLARPTRAGVEPSIVELADAVVMPSFVNAHTPLELSWMRSDPTPHGDPIEWALAMIRRRKPSDEEIASGIAWAIEEMKRGGTGLVADVGNTTAALRPRLESGM